MESSSAVAASFVMTQNSKKRVFSGGSSSSSYADPDVVEIAPPVYRASSSKSSKKKEVICYEIIDVDMDEDGDDIMLIDEVHSSKKGKEALDIVSLGPSGAAKLGSIDGVQPSKKTLELGSKSSSNLSGSISGMDNCQNDYMDKYFDDFMYDDDYSVLQSHFDNIDIPPGIEAAIPWFGNKTPSSNEALLNSQKQSNSASSPTTEAVVSHSKQSLDPSQIERNSTSMINPRLRNQLDQKRKYKKMSDLTRSTYLSSRYQKDAMNVPPALNGWNPWHQSGLPHGNQTYHVSGGSSYENSHSQPGSLKLPAKVGPYHGGPWLSHGYDGNSNFFQNLDVPMDAAIPHGVDGPSHKWLSNGAASSGIPDSFYGFPDSQLVENHSRRQHVASHVGSSTPSTVSSSTNEEILNKLQNFKNFDTVQDYSDHYFKSQPSVQQPKNWTKKIQEEWKILEKDLPDTIFVRVYETRMDLLRAVIIGAEGTPYHDGLFFFDVYFPSQYPNIPPHVHYHSGGLRLNPNLYNCGKVCLSLLNTWTGGHKEKWMPGVSTMLQVLVSIQGLILNAKPYFNEPGYAHLSRAASGEQRSLEYNERTFILSLKTMVYTMRKPPKYFEDLVAGHFCKRAHDILVACKAYVEGAQVGCLVKGGVQDVDEGDKSCSQRFKYDLASNITTLTNEFAKFRAKDIEKFRSLAQTSTLPPPPPPPPMNAGFEAFDYYNYM